MPLVCVSMRPGLIPHDKCRELGDYIRPIVAAALHSAPHDPDGALTPKEIEVRFRDIDPRDVNAQPFMVEIFANEYPFRRSNLYQRARLIQSGLRACRDIPLSVQGEEAGENRGFVWVLLAPGAFVML